MRFTLKDYQELAVAKMLGYFRDAHDDVHRKDRNVAFSLAATTGAGKTVMAAAVIEALFFGDDDFNFRPDDGAVVLWFTGDRSLNEQTRSKLMDSADRIGNTRLKVIENTFSQKKFEPGNVYFLNSQKLNKNALLVRGASMNDQDNLWSDEAMPDLRAFTIWDTISNTIADERLTLYVILDEAHKGMKKSSKKDREERSTIVKQLINGEAGAPSVPVVWGISATIERFTTAMEGAKERILYPPYEVDSGLIQESGLLKDDIRLEFPTEPGTFDTVLLARGVTKLKAADAGWREYLAGQGLPKDAVVPLLVVQVPNKPPKELLRSAVDTIYETWKELPRSAIAHVFGEHAPLEIEDLKIPHIPPERVQDESHIRVLLAKDAVSTGWDCPRAEVLVSFRSAEDRTHITQLLGRMVRTPLARRVEGNDRLNSVECILPKFNRNTATSVAEVLLGSTDDDDDHSGGSGGGDGRRVLIEPQDMLVNSPIPPEVWTAFDALPSQTLPRTAAKPTKRLGLLAQALSRDGIVEDARKLAYGELFKILDGLAVRFADEIEAATDQILEVEGEIIVAKVGGRGVSETKAFREIADDRAVSAEFKNAQRVFSADVARQYAEHTAVDDGHDDGLFDAELKVAAMAQVAGISEALDRDAHQIAEDWLAAHRVRLKDLTDERRQVYTEIIGMSDEPERIELVRPSVRSEETKTIDGDDVNVRHGHLMSDGEGNFPIGSLGSWEVGVLDAEMARDDFLAWYRNPGRASEDSLAVAYRDGNGNWRRMCPDFVFFHGETSGVKASIVDPHGFHLSDALPKLRGLADFAEEFGDEFHRIEAVASTRGKDGGLRVLDVREPAVRTAIRNAQD
ncbi:MAG: DEAD/DEAH box helicase, partial [Solirubrobacterales bacterium]